jgi:starch synthase (maltosyl-transferring)
MQAADPTIGPVPRQLARVSTRGAEAGARAVYTMNLMRSRGSPESAFVAWLRELGFDALLLALPRCCGTSDIDGVPAVAEAAASAGLRVYLDLTIDIAGDSAPVVRRHPGWFRTTTRAAADPRGTPMPTGMRTLNVQTPADIDAVAAYWTSTLRELTKSGISGFRCKPSSAIPVAIWKKLIEASPDLQFAIWTPGAPADEVRRLPHGLFSTAYNSLAWWDFGTGWLREEVARLAPLAPVANTVALPDAPSAGPHIARAARRLLDVAGNNGAGLLLPMGFEFGIPSQLPCPLFGADDWRHLRDHAPLDFKDMVRDANSRVAARPEPATAPDIMSGEDAPVAVLFETPTQLTLANRYLNKSALLDPSAVLPELDGAASGFIDNKEDPLGPAPIVLAPGEVRVYNGTETRPIIKAAPREGAREPEAARATAAAGQPRVVIEAIEPTVDGGRFAVKRTVGERITAEADIFADGHGEISAALQWRARDESDWHELAMRLVENDRWAASFLLERIGLYQYRIIAWPDRFETYRDELTKKHAAGLNVTLEIEEGRLLLEAIAAEAPGALDDLLATLKSSSDPVALLTSDSTAAAVARADPRPGQTVSAEMPVDADRHAAEFASWYELFPRNQTGDPARHGTFRNVIQRLPAIRDMGFDVLYFPPIHPIGRKNRKGRDNTMTPAADDPGSPYAIGADEGGHDAIHPELGTIDDFRALRDAAAEHGLELALDFAIQASPDHPWLDEHPEWFDWRPDGGLRYAENPPKKYEDIVNVDFYRPGAIPGLWMALRDVVAYWAQEGVRIFRVDNPHTKPFAFWEWMIADIKANYPGTLFLSEAFTRPKVMYQLAKLGFSQSYTYFTWRNEKAEIEAYLRELTEGSPGATSSEVVRDVPRGVPEGTKVVDFFRPNFFVNTPDINPEFLQRSGRAGFLIRAALASTLSGLWGMLQGFELCEAKGLPGREEYAESDKYQLRVRPERAPGDIVDEITRLNAIRRANPALHSHRGLAFHHAYNDRVLWYRKANIDRSNVVLIAVSLDPFAPQTTGVEVPLWEWGLGDSAALVVTDLMRGGSTTWYGKNQTISLDPRTLPFGIWRARPQEIS